MQQNNFINTESLDRENYISPTVQAFLVYGIAPAPLDLGPVACPSTTISRRLVLPESIAPAFTASAQEVVDE